VCRTLSPGDSVVRTAALDRWQPAVVQTVSEPETIVQVRRLGDSVR
jgi:hypothetical protein